MTQPALVPFRQYARAHVDKAKALLEGHGQDLVYACLELRLAIEALAYDILQGYGDDLNSEVDAAHQVWQPTKVLKRLRAYDPLAETPLRVVLWKIGADGEAETDVQSFEATDDRFTADWVEKAYHSMSSFLHQRTIAQIKKSDLLDEDALKHEANCVLNRMEEILGSEIHDLRIGIRFGYSCPDCGGDLSVALLPLLLKGRARTTCPSCSAEWEVGPGNDPGHPKFTRWA